MNITVDKLISVLTPRTIATKANTNAAKISKEMYNIRKNILTARLARIFDILQVNYWTKLSELIDTEFTSPIALLTHLKRIEISTANQVIRIINNYLIDIYVILSILRTIKDEVECSIEYEEMQYE